MTKERQRPAVGTSDVVDVIIDSQVSLTSYIYTGTYIRTTGAGTFIPPGASDKKWKKHLVSHAFITLICLNAMKHGGPKEMRSIDIVRQLSGWYICANFVNNAIVAMPSILLKNHGRAHKHNACVYRENKDFLMYLHPFTQLEYYFKDLRMIRIEFSRSATRKATTTS